MMKVGFVYKLVSEHTPLIYVGSTTKKYLCDRLSSHKYEYKNNSNKSCSSIELFKLGDVKIECLEVVKYSHRQELVMKEAEYIRKLDCVNKKIEGRTKQEWYQDNKEKELQKAKDYYQNNKEKILKNYCEVVICECGCEITKGNMLRHLKSPKHSELLSKKHIDLIKE